MNKRQLAATIWKSANEMRSKIEANEYKDYILGFIFYRYLSENELHFFKKQGMSDEEIRGMNESDTEFVNFTKEEIGYFIAYVFLFSLRAASIELKTGIKAAASSSLQSSIISLNCRSDGQSL